MKTTTLFDYKTQPIAQVEVPLRVYYYVLEYSFEENHKYIKDNFNKNTPHELNKEEFLQLFNHISLLDLKFINNNF